MGNAQSGHSAEAGESHGRTRASHQQKLSKPKVGNPSTASLLRPGPSGRRNSTPGSIQRTSSVPPLPTGAVERVNSGASGIPTAEQLNKQLPPVDKQLPPLVREPQDRHEADERQEQKMSRRLSIFRSRSSTRESETSRPGMSRRRSIFGSSKKIGDSVSQANSRVTSRANSMTVDSEGNALYSVQVPDARPPNGSRTSWNYDMNSYEARRLLNLPEQPNGHEYSSAVSESRHTVASDAVSSSAAQVEIAPISRVNSDVSLYAPARRRSIAQVPGVATRTHSLVESSTRPNFRHSLPPTPNMSRQASMESMRSRHLSMPPPLPTPDPALLALAPRVLTPSDGEYQTIGAFKLGTLRIVNGAASPAAPSPEPMQARKEVDRKPADYFSRPRKSLPNGGVEERLKMTHLQIPSKVAVAADAGLLNPSSDVSGAQSEGNGEKFLPSIQCSPFDVAEPAMPSPGLKTTSKHTAMEDDLFDDDAQLEFASREVLDIRVDPNAKSDGKHPPRVSSLARSDSGFVPSPTSEYSMNSLKPLSKADSGYSSNVSLRSLRGSEKYSKGKGQASQVNQGPISPQSNSSLNNLPSPVSASTSRSQSAKSGELPPMPPPKDLSSTPTSQTTKDVPATTPIPLFNKHRLKKRPSPTPISTVKTAESGLRSPDSARSARSPMSATSTGSGSMSNSSLSVGSGTQKRSKMHRIFSMTSTSQRGPPTTHATHVADQSGLPSIPPMVEERLNQHVGLYPSAPKRLALRSQRSKDTLKTIFSVGSLEFNSIELEPASTSATKPEVVDEAAPESQKASRRHTLQAALLKPIARKPLPLRKNSVQDLKTKASTPEVVEMADAQKAMYSSVNMSLGASPYDAACSSSQASRNSAGRAMSMTTQMDRTAALKALTASRRHSFSPDDVPNSPSSYNLAVPELAHLDPTRRGRTPPPVSMRTQRKPAALRGPPPVRSKSTPPSHPRPMLTIDEKHAIPPALPSRYHPQRPTSQHRPIPVRDPRMAQGSWSRSSSREPSPGPNSSRRNSLDQSRNNSLSSQGRTNSNFGLQRPASSLAQRQPMNNAPPLRHRASYDGVSNGHRQSWVAPGYVQQGYMQRQMQQEPITLLAQNGVPFVPQGGNISHQRISQQSLDEGSRYPPSFPRGHHRHRSMGNPKQAPFRVLHSYNSPAYRGVPIWG